MQAKKNKRLPLTADLDLTQESWNKVPKEIDILEEVFGKIDIKELNEIIKNKIKNKMPKKKRI